jgi:hypothetical protein
MLAAGAAAAVTSAVPTANQAAKACCFAPANPVKPSHVAAGHEKFDLFCWQSTCSACIASSAAAAYIPTHEPCWSMSPAGPCLQQAPTNFCAWQLQLHHDRPGKHSSCTQCEATGVTSAYAPVVESESRSSKVSNSVAVAAALAPSCSAVADKPCTECAMQHTNAELR